MANSFFSSPRLAMSFARFHPKKMNQTTKQDYKNYLKSCIKDFEQAANVSANRLVSESNLRMADVLRYKLGMLEKSNLTPAQRHEAKMMPDPENDDLITIIRKLGGINMETGDREEFWRGRLNSAQKPIVGLPNIEQYPLTKPPRRPPRYHPQSLDLLTEALVQLRYLQDPAKDVRELEELLDYASSGIAIYSDMYDWTALERYSSGWVNYEEYDPRDEEPVTLEEMRQLSPPIEAYTEPPEF